MTTPASRPSCATWHPRWRAAEAENRRLRVEFDAVANDAAFHKEENRRLREGLRKLLGPNPNYDPDGQHDYGWENDPPKAFAPQWVRDEVHALLAGSEAEQERHVIHWEDDPSRTRIVRGVCRVCDRQWPIDILEPQVVSANGIAHHLEAYGMTLCGKDATGDAWWWAL